MPGKQKAKKPAHLPSSKLSGSAPAGGDSTSAVDRAAQTEARAALGALLAEQESNPVAEDELQRRVKTLSEQHGAALALQLGQAVQTTQSSRRELAAKLLLLLQDKRAVPALWDVVRNTEDAPTKLLAYGLLHQFGEQVDLEQVAAQLDPQALEGLWQDQCAAILKALEEAASSEQRQTLLQQISLLPEQAQLYLVDGLAKQHTLQSANLLYALGEIAGQREVRKAARHHLQALRLLGIKPDLAASGEVISAPSTAAFYQGFIQQSRHTGEQIIILVWRKTDGWLQSLLFLVNHRRTGIQDFYPTRDINDDELALLIEHNRAKNGEMVPVSLGEAKTLLQAGLELNKKHGTPLPQEYKENTFLIESRVFKAETEPYEPHCFLNPDLTPQEIATSFLEGWTYGDYELLYELVEGNHPWRKEPERSTALRLIQQQVKDSPRRRSEIEILDSTVAAEEATVTVKGETETIDKLGKHTRRPFRERYGLIKIPVGWRIRESGEIER